MMRFHTTQFFDCSQSLQMHLNLLLSSDLTDQSICNPLILLHHPCRNFNLSNYQPRQDVTQLTLEIWTNDGWVLGGFADDVMMLGITLFVRLIFQTDKPSASDANSWNISYHRLYTGQLPVCQLLNLLVRAGRNTQGFSPCHRYPLFLAVLPAAFISERKGKKRGRAKG